MKTLSALKYTGVLALGAIAGGLATHQTEKQQPFQKVESKDWQSFPVVVQDVRMEATVSNQRVEMMVNKQGLLVYRILTPETNE